MIGEEVMKKLLKKLSVFLVLFSFLFVPIVHAQSNIQILTSLGEEEVKFTEKLFLKVNENGHTEPISLKEFEKVEELVREEFKQNEKEVIFNSESVNPEKILEGQITNTVKTESDIDLQNVGYIGITTETLVDPNNRRIILEASITELIGAPPVIVIVGRNLYNNNQEYGAFRQVFDMYVEWTGPQIRVGQTYSDSYSVTSSQYWMTSTTSVAGWLGAAPITRTAQSYPFLTNSRAVLYPIIFNEHSRQYMPHPHRTDLQWIPESQRVPWNSTLRGYYIRDYIDTYGDPRWDWAQLDVHHVVQRQYGGTNNFDNLYPLPRELHQQVVERWWDHY